MNAKLSPGFKEFLIKSGIFLILFIIIQLSTMALASKTFLPPELKPIAFDDLAEATFFVLIIFLSLNREKLMKLKKYSFSWKQTIISTILIAILFPIYFIYKDFLLKNLEDVIGFAWFYVGVEYLILLTILFFLAIAVYGKEFIKNFFNQNKKGLLTSFLGLIIIYPSIKKFQESWPVLSGFVANAVSYFLSFMGRTSLIFANGMPIIRFNDFAVGIAKTCSGIDSIFLFVGLFIAVLAWDYKILNKKKMALIFLPGLVGSYLLNILRIFLLILIGSYVSPSFALNAFHTNASAILFLIYFAIYWRIFYKWALISEKEQKSNHLNSVSKQTL